MSLKAMSVSRLKALKSQVEAAIRMKVTERRHEIELELVRLPPVASIHADDIPAQVSVAA